ncbi:putative gluconate 2-dehydrogenase [Pseudomonas syringae pv. antirrhini]|uniref:Putative gluconate 2-dehydrogenase n=1 Tax=Pseudomonas syringae pv. antirrhini TaxID=251702 RepID=A0A0P9P7H4_9PSED|nr:MULTISPECIES: cytochrome c [Pseudomonas]KPW52754.1 putative gluconate 2-dehydrogenase [Pseudomonas syringae pv. antirrhini]RMP32114.1 putative gluconate 2-dehydrogenase [Pseudomonas syringae pv. antirrhini]WIN08843.1 cytochrome c [Pseudomonas syringae pv. antirrhini str. 126]
MNKVIKILSVGTVVAIGALVWFVESLPRSTLTKSSAQAVNSELIRRGEYIARLGDCVACHSIPKGEPFAGGLEMATPMGSIYSTNITGDEKWGIGRYTLQDFDRAVRAGVRPNGERMYPAMPYPSYAKFSDEDIEALYAFFMRGVKPSLQPNQASEIPFPLNMRWPLALWNAVFVKNGAYKPDSSQDSSWNRGAYLVQGPGHCGSCHTPRSLTMNEKALDESSPLFLSGALLDGWYAPSLRQDVNTGLGRWSEADIFDYLKSGRNQHSVVVGTMAEVFNNSTQYMSDPDLAGIAAYLVSLKGDPARDVVAPLAPNASTADSQAGATIYAAKCSSCHGSNGQGQGQWIPPLAGASSAMISASDTVVNVTLNGSARVVLNGIPDTYRMPSYRNQLSDKEIADVLSFVRGSWGNRGGDVKPDKVKSLRESTNPASSSPIVLQMR